MENLQADSFARDYHMTAELAAKKDGTMTALRIKTLADHGYTDAAANPSKFPAGLFSICTGSYDIPHAFTEVDAAYTNKPPGGIAYRCSFRVTEAVHAIERITDVLAQELKTAPAELRLKNFIPPDKFPYKSALGWEYDSGNYAPALRKAMEMIGYAALRKEQAEKRSRGELMGIGISSFTEIVGAGPSKDFDILGIKMFDSAEIRIHPTGKAIARFGTKSQGQGHETTYAQIVAEELGIPAEPHLPLRQLHLRRQRRPRHGDGQDPPLRGGRRLRQHHQPDDRRWPDPRRPEHGHGAGAPGGDQLRRERQHLGRQLHGLPRPHRHGDPQLGDREDDHPLAPPSA